MMKPEFDFNTKCRACFSEEQEMHHLYSEFDQGLSLSEILKSVISLEIKEDDGLSAYLCDNCTTVVVDFFNFVTIYQANQKYIKSLLSEENLKNTVDEGKCKTQEENSETEMCGNKFDKYTTKHSNTNRIPEKHANNSDFAVITEVFEDCSLNKDIGVNKELQITGSFVDPQDIVEQGLLTSGEIIIKYEDAKIADTMKYCCQVCGELFLLKTQFLQHMHKQHKKPSQRDEHIPKTIIKKENILKSEIKVENIILKCNICKREFTTCSDLETHYKVHKKYICEHCGIGFTKKSYLDDHFEVHTTEKRHICPICGKAFRRRTVLVKHKKIHTHPRQCVCEICGLRFNDKGTLKTHIMLKHTKERNFPCTICGQWFPLKSTLDKHVFRHNDNRERPFNCSICTMAYRDKSSLNRHVIVKHTINAKRPSCQYCGKRYTTNTNLMKHIRKSHGSKVDLDSD